jgi:hypothetical protein
MRDLDTLITYGATVKVLATDGDLVTVGGLGVIFDDPARPIRDLTGDYFTKDSYLGAHMGDGVDCLVQHGYPLAARFAHLSDRLLTPVKTSLAPEDRGLLVSTVLSMRDEYEAALAELASAGKMAWSSGVPGHMVIRERDGHLKRWPIAEFSLTPTPAEPRTAAVPLKSIAALAALESGEVSLDEYEHLVRSLETLNLRLRLQATR